MRNARLENPETARRTCRTCIHCWTLAYTTAYGPCAARPTDPVPRGLLTLCRVKWHAEHVGHVLTLGRASDHEFLAQDRRRAGASLSVYMSLYVPNMFIYVPVCPDNSLL